LNAYVVVDLGFGDSGKGLLTDFLVRQFGARVVVRYNGGAQAGHHVVTPDGRHHTFAQFGSGTFIPGVQTYLSRHVVIHPAALLAEGDILEQRGVRDVFSRIRVSDRALVITPFHQAANRIREIWRGSDRHGSCGVGVGETVEDSLLHAEDSVLAGDLNHPAILRQKMRSIRDQKREQLVALCGENPTDPQLTWEWQVFEREDLIDTWIASITRISKLDLVVPDSVLEGWLCETESVIFEGAQGVLLDADAGFHPYTTWSRCTTANALDLIAEMAPDSRISSIGVIRSYAVRHGPGPFPTETDVLTSLISEHNKYSEWQGPVRYGWFDKVLAQYALDRTGGVDAFALTHIDLLQHLETWKYCTGYKNYNDLNGLLVDMNISDGVLGSLHVPRFLSLDQRAHLTQALSTVVPLLETCEVEEKSVIRKIESLIGHSVDIISRGPSTENVQILNSFPA